MAGNLKSKVESTARYYGSAARKSDARAGFVMGAHEIVEYARDKFEDNFREAAASKYKAHFIATLRSAYLGKAGVGKKKSNKKKHGPAVKAKTLIERACKGKHVPSFLKRYC